MTELSATTKLNTKKKAQDFVKQFLCNKTNLDETLCTIADDKGIDKERLDLSVDSLDYLFGWLVANSEFNNIQDKESGPFWVEFDALFAVTSKYSVDTLFMIDFCVFYFGEVLAAQTTGTSWSYHLDTSLKGRNARYNGKYTPCIVNEESGTFSCPIFFLFYHKLRKAKVHGIQDVQPVSQEAISQINVLNNPMNSV
ncbi:hypothetical protein TUMSATVNIG1_58490 (plasmid) [Vibrio nigripulchritudo]|uniref:hypothetical protein n=1 Tax=Vibrio nigripulchritudo TaxID=28173 RepID=UPI00190CE280|nr:hypothetical protein [Vibrio nigripulchritudo]BCL73864.1 hypothetical protein VNTUMSATTG_58010 [Vibrio nigripulchritudo]BDU35240.1 hypothetical protein TUMSATVNIG1_58490 [Vibrio nigripulchritudo]